MAPTPLRIGIIGAGFSGTSLAANLYQESQQPTEIVLLEKTGKFGAGPAYSTPYFYHLLNVRAHDMSAFPLKPKHFVQWLMENADEKVYSQPGLPLAEQFVPRKLYGKYLQNLLADISKPNKNAQVRCEAAEVIDLIPCEQDTQLILSDGRTIAVDKVVLALGNNPPVSFAFPVAEDIKCINNPWDYQAVQQIASTDPVLIVGAGLSMIDAALTLHYQNHQGPIYVLSRHGLLPLPHTNIKTPFNLVAQQIPKRLPALTKQLRNLSANHMQDGGDWRTVVNAFRSHLPEVWQDAELFDKKRFLRHVLPYWNIHRHRVHEKIMELLTTLQEQQQMQVFAGRLLSVAEGKAKIQARHSRQVMELDCQWLINCMGPAQHMRPEQHPLIKALFSRGLATLDPLHLGFAVDESGALINEQKKASLSVYTLGPPTKGATWECSAVPEIRKQVAALVRRMLASY